MPKKIKEVIQDLSIETVPMSDYLKLKQECDATKETVSKLLKELDKERNISTSPIIQGAYSPEMEIIDLQIHRIQMLSREGKLKMEDAKILDILIKNKKLLQEEKPVDADFEVINENTSVQELMTAIESNNEQKKRPN